MPKQLQRLAGDHTMLQSTLLRMSGVEGLAPPIVVCGVDQLDVIADQLAEIDATPQVMVGEPSGRNTAAAIAAAALVAAPGTILAVLPADHVVSDLETFRRAMDRAVEAAAGGGLVTFGVVPTRPETGYGYISAHGDGDLRPIRAFVEKPDAETAGAFVEGGAHFWNSGMFVFRTDSVLVEFERHAPAVVDAVRRSLRPAVGGRVEAGPEFEEAPAVPFDVAVMERTDRGVMVPLAAGWDDVGSWRSLWEIGGRDGDGNVAVGDAVLHDTRGSYVRSHGRPVVVLGVEDVVVVDAGDVVFVSSMRHAQDVRRLVERLDEERPELT
jgi:mannose-1-phosphate guanylyltransferase/mannose-6-phosphate isomerase